MKKFLTLMFIAAATIASVPQAEARPRPAASIYVSGRTSCGCPAYTQRYVAYHDRFGYPVFKYRRLPVTHRCRPVVRYTPARRQPTNYQGYRSVPRSVYGNYYARRYPSSSRYCR